MTGGARIALPGFSIECHRFAPPATEADDRARCRLEGEAMLADARAGASCSLGGMPGFVQNMDRAGPWQPRPVLPLDPQARWP
ncbi:hypothetical protein [Teichococcus vastitatis]|uniref:Uncharacterized protein n=1 Tax=Teichococcus vastitatis TaxID=2307076 RepID=A0ABS9WC24_9PROT|nr:hypothetical protein [Pseudoroseomonas vastitatis]MCI0756845.1 hypothetical protein [Pseudoroseomonas vastitatis]